MSHYTHALELLGRADSFDRYEVSDGEMTVLLLAALTHAVLSMTDAVERRGRWCDEAAS